MMLSKEEAISICLYFARDNKINSKVKLNKIVAFLNTVGLPVDIIFELNKHGSYAQDLTEDVNNILSQFSYSYEANRTGFSFKLKEEGLILAREVLKNKITPLFNQEEISIIQNKINEFNEMSADSLSQFEHTKFRVDVQDRFKLKQESNTIHIDYLDIYAKTKQLESTNYALIDIKGIVEFYFYLSKFLKNRFNKIEEDIYEFGQPMINYYLLFILKEQLELLKPNIKALAINKESLFKLNRMYNAVQELIAIYDFPFSLENPKLKELI